MIEIKAVLLSLHGLSIWQDLPQPVRSKSRGAPHWAPANALLWGAEPLGPALPAAATKDTNHGRYMHRNRERLNSPTLTFLYSHLSLTFL